MKFGRDTNGTVYTNETFITPIGYGDWLTLVTPKAYQPKAGEKALSSTPKYMVSLLLDKKSPTVIKFKQQVEEVTKPAIEFYNENSSVPMPESQPCFKDGDSPKKDAKGKTDKEKYPHYAGKWILRATNAAMPVVLAKSGKEPFDPKELKNGMKIRLKVSVHLTSKGIHYKLITVQFIEDDGTRYASFEDPAAGMDAVDGMDALEKEEETPFVPAKAPANKSQGKSGKEVVLDVI